MRSRRRCAVLRATDALQGALAGTAPLDALALVEGDRAAREAFLASFARA